MVQFSQCLDCKNFIDKSNDLFICKAFPQGIPSDIFWNKISHTDPIDGDGGVRFQERD